MTMRYRKSFIALKLIFGGNEQALVLVDLLESYAYRFSDEWVRMYGEVGVTEDGFFAKARRLITEDTGILTASVKTAINNLEKEGFVETQSRHLNGYKDKIIHYRVCIEVTPYLQKAFDYLDKPHRPDDRKAVRKILLPFIDKLADFNHNIIEALKIGPPSYIEYWQKRFYG